MRTRGAAAALAGSGHVRVNGARIGAPSRFVRIGDVITVALDRTVRVLKVKGFIERRGPRQGRATAYMRRWSEALTSHAQSERGELARLSAMR